MKGRKKLRIQNAQASFDCLSSCSKISAKEDNCLSTNDDELIPMEYSFKNIGDFKKQETEMEYVHPTDNFQSWDSSLAKCTSKASRKCENSQRNSDNHFSSAEDYFLENSLIAAERSNNNVDNNNLSFSWGNESSEFDICVNNGSARSAVPSNTQEFIDDLEMSRVTMEPFLKSCSAHGRLPCEGAFFADNELDFPSDGFRTEQVLSVPYHWDDVPETDSSDQSFRFLSETSWHDQAPTIQPYPKVLPKSDPYAQFDCLPRAFVNEENLDEGNDCSFDTVENRGSIEPGHLTLRSRLFFETSDPLSHTTPWDVERYTEIDILDESSRSVKRASNEHFLDDEDRDYRFDIRMKSNSSSQENHGLDYASASQFPKRYNLTNKIPPFHPDTSTDQKDLLSCDSHGKDHTDTRLYKSQRDCYAYTNQCRNYHPFRGRTRSHSAPPFYRIKRRFSALKHPMTMKTSEVNCLAYPGRVI